MELDAEQTLYTIRVTACLYQEDDRTGAFWWQVTFTAEGWLPEETLRCGIHDRFLNDCVTVTSYDGQTGAGCFVCMNRAFEPGQYALSVGPNGAHDCDVYRVHEDDLGSFCGVCGRHENRAGGRDA